MRSVPDEAPSARDSAIDLVLPAEAERVAIARHATDGLATIAGLSDEQRAGVALAVGEACANVVVHAYATAERSGELFVHAVAEPGRLSVVVGDRGPGMGPRSDSPGIGLGLPLMASLCTTLEVRQRRGGGTEVCMIFESSLADACERWAQTG